MKKILFFLLNVSFIWAGTANHIVVTTIMIKNEEHSIEDTLKPLVKGGIDAYLIFDTGSTDNTLEIVHRFFQKYPYVQAVVKQEPFVDFSTSRNRAFQLAREAFPESEFLFMPDAEWILHGVEELIQFCQEEKGNRNAIPSYLMRVLGGSLDYHSARLIRTHGPARYVGKVHECIVPATIAKIPPHIYLEQRSYERGLAQSKERWKRDRKLLEQAYEEDPTDCRTLFYLGQTCGCLNDFPAACHYYKIRAKMNGWEEENFMACYRLAEATEKLAEEDESKLPEAISHYLEAYNMRPRRAEPLIKLAECYLKQGKHPLAYLFALKATEIDYPKEDILFVNKYLYDFTRYDILSQCAWYVNEKEVGLAALKKALAVQPDAEYLHRNLTFYQED